MKEYRMKLASTVLAFSLLLVLAVVRAGDPLPDYAAEQLTERVWVIHGPVELPNPENKGFMNNPAFVVTEDGVVIVDAGASLESGRMVLRQIEKVTDKPVTHVFTSHIHGDHWLGNQAVREKYPEARLYAHPVMIEQAKAGEAESWVNMMERLTEGATKGTEAVIPDIALSDGQEIVVGGITFRAHLSDWAHTKTDAMIEVVEESLLATGDNVLFKRIGRLDDASFRGNIAACDRALELKLKHYIPGHGPSGTADVIEPFCTYLKTVYAKVGELYEEGLSDFEMKDAVVEDVSAYKDWSGFDEQVGKHISLAVLEIEQAEFE